MNLEYMRENIKYRNLILISIESDFTKNSITSKTSLKWKCKNCNVEWLANWNNIHAGKGCPECNGNKKLTIDKIKENIKERNIELISDVYINANTYLKWKCKICENEWMARWYNIKSGTGCPACAHNNKLTIEIIKEKIKNRSYTLISTYYINALTILEWKCNLCNYLWKASWSNIAKNTGCPNCSSFKNEKQCRKIFEEILNVKFKKYRFYYNNKRFELDGYNKELNIAFEYNGEQHYNYPNKYQKTKQEFLDAQVRDYLKEE